MAEYERGQVYDGFVTLERGMDSGRTAASLPTNQVSFAVNTTFRGGYPKTRPGLKKCPLTFPNTSGTLDETLAAAFADGRFQGAEFYDGGLNPSSLLASIGGSLYRIAVESAFAVQDISPPTLNSSLRPRAWFCQAEEFMLVNDGQSKTIVYDGGTTTRLTRDDELPVGTAMVYANGRMWVALPNGISFMAGDIVYGSSGTAAREYRDSILKQTENNYLNEGGYFAMPPNCGGIVALRTTNNLDTSLGQGPLLVLTPNLVASVQAPIDRTTWKDLNYPIQTVALLSYGAVSEGSVVNVNGDLFYRAEDGIRSFAMARREFGQWGNTPISAEMNRVLEYDTGFLLEHSSSVVFNNRLLVTCSPYIVQDHGIAHRGLSVLDFDILSRMAGVQPPAWDGLWTGLNVLKLVKGRFAGQERCFAFVLNGAKQIELWELTLNDPHDSGDAGDTPIEWYPETRAFDFQSPFDLKNLEFGELWLDELRGAVEIQAYYRPDEYAQWVDWHSAGWTEEATDTFAAPDSTTPPEPPRTQSRSKMRLPNPDSTVDEIEERPFKQFFRLQVLLKFVGHCRLKQVRLVARPEQEQARGEYRT
jgi:hypothetical protein